MSRNRRTLLVLLLAVVAIGAVAIVSRDGPEPERGSRAESTSADRPETTNGGRRHEPEMEAEQVPKPPRSARGPVLRILADAKPVAGAVVREVVGAHAVREPVGAPSRDDGYVEPAFDVRGRLLQVTRDGFLTRDLAVPTDAPDLFEIELREISAGIRVEVRDADDAPLPTGVAYLVLRHGNNRAARSRDAGVSRFDVDPAEVQSVFAADESGRHAPAVVPLSDRPEDWGNTVVRLTRANPVRVQVVDESSERPVEAARISPMFGRGHGWITNAAGNTDIPIDPDSEGKFVGVVWANGFRARFISIPSKEREAVRVALQRGPWIDGTLLVDGQPVADALCAGETRDFLGRVARTDAAGAFVLSALAEREEAIQILLPARFGVRKPILRRFPTDLEPGIRYRWTIDLQPRETRVRIVDQGDHPQIGAHVGFEYHAVRSDADGVARVRRLGDEPELLRIRAGRAMAYALLTTEESLLVTARAARDLNGVLLGFPPGREIHVYLDVKLAGEWRWLDVVTAGPDGSWTFGAQPERHEYRVRAGGSSLERIAPGRPVALRYSAD